MYDLITIGSALIDIFIRSKQFILRPTSKGTLICQLYGEKIDVDSFLIATGGGGSNAAVGFARAGFNVATVTETGKDTLADLLLSEFHKECVATNYVAQERREETGGSVIMLGEDGGRTVMVHRGASSLLDPHDIPMRAVKKPIGSIFLALPEDYRPYGQSLLASRKARRVVPGILVKLSST